MKFTLPWLKVHLETDASLAEIVDKLTMIGLEVENVEDKADLLKPFVIASVISAEKHPNADRLKVCMVDIGDGKPTQVVCGAPNARTGMKGVFSAPGTFIPGKNITLTVGTIRGVESRGMLCSAAELMISDDDEGIIDLPADAPIGKSYVEWAGASEPVIEINLTPNRPDCTGVSGIARDLGATSIGTYKDKIPKPVKGSFPCPVKITLDFGKTPSLCPAFGLRLVRGVKNGPSPDWLQKRLTAIGLRPINALVDITNFITFDRGRPLHVFDADKVHGNLTVRRARTGEKLLALDGKTYTLDDAVCVIADEKSVESLSGIMGGEATGCSETTTNVLVESALWDELNIAQTGRKLGINSDARYRFERGVDPAFMLPGPRARHPDGARPLRRRSVGNHCRRQSDAEGKDHRFSAQRTSAAHRAETAACGPAACLGKTRLFHRRSRRACESRRAILAARRSRPCRYRRGARAYCWCGPCAIDSFRARAGPQARSHYDFRIARAKQSERLRRADYLKP